VTRTNDVICTVFLCTCSVPLTNNCSKLSININSPPQISRLSKNEVSGGLSGAELIAACRDAALKALEDFEENENGSVDPIITTDHLLTTLTGMERQITQEMLDFYATFQGNPIR
jgi:SpoVK/Ycf46/Vps4 family AAA+-type ATPase